MAARLHFSLSAYLMAMLTEQIVLVTIDRRSENNIDTVYQTMQQGGSMKSVVMYGSEDQKTSNWDSWELY